MRLRNTDVSTRTYFDLQRKENKIVNDTLVALAGTTLELEPGEEAEVDVPEQLVKGIKDDPYLQVIDAPAAEAPRRSRRIETTEQEPASA